MADRVSQPRKAVFCSSQISIHKSKGKEFDEVVVFEGSRTGRLLRDNATGRETEQARLALRVAVTRAKQRTTILTPSWASCPLV